jgi:hypothetical protein
MNQKSLEIKLILYQLGISPDQFYRWEDRLGLDRTAESFDKNNEIACTLAESGTQLADDDGK